jgi:hypothetical protein
MTRKSPTKHPVRGHIRGDVEVSPYVRGSGEPIRATISPRKRQVIGGPAVVKTIRGREVEMYAPLKSQHQQGLNYYLKYLEYIERMGGNIIDMSWQDFLEVGCDMANYVYAWDKNLYDMIASEYNNFKDNVALENFTEAMMAIAEIAAAVKEVNKDYWGVSDDVIESTMVEMQDDAIIEESGVDEVTGDAEEA